MARRRAFVLRHTRLQPVPGVETLRLHLGGDVLALWRAAQIETRDQDTPMPYWAFAWGGGLALARYLLEHPEVVRGRRVFDLGSGSGLCAIAAMTAGATAATANDIDPYAAEAIELNARANGCRVAVLERDVLDDDEPPDADVILAADTSYEEAFASRVHAWLRRARDRGATVFVGDPGRRYLQKTSLTELARYEVRTTTELEDLALKDARVYALRH
jgi:predicted nicotinamide N-methyase